MALHNALDTGQIAKYCKDGYVFPVPALVPARDMDPDIVAFVDRRYGGKSLGVAANQTGTG